MHTRSRTLFLPLPSTGSSRRALRIPVAPARVQRPRTVLLVDASDDCRAINGAVLRHHGFDVLEAGNGPDGARMALEHLPHAVVMELRLPGMDGWALLERIKRAPALAFTPLLAVTAAADVSRAEALATGFAEILAKPCPPLRVLSEIRRLTMPVI